MSDEPEAKSVTEESTAPTPKLIDRIKKLLALANSSNANEAASAAAKAAELMQEHKLSEADVSDDMEDGSEITELPMGAEGFLASWKFALVSQVARSFFCEAIALRHMKRRKVRIVGRRRDAEVASHVFEHFVREIERLAKEERNDSFVVLGEMTGTMDPRDYLNHFRQGAAAGIADKLKLVTASFAKQSEKAMVLVTTSKDELRGYLKNKFGDSKVVSNDGMGRDASNEMAFARGYEKGADLSVPGRDRAIVGDVKVVDPPFEPPLPQRPEPPAPSAFKQFDGYETSTRVCPCGAAFTWSGFSDDLDGWMKIHEPHAGGRSVKQETTADGERAYGPRESEDDDDLSRGSGGRSPFDPFRDGKS